MKTIKVYTLFIVVACCAVYISGCTSRANNSMPAEKHMSSVHSPGSGMIYIDKVDCQRVMQQQSGEAMGFHCYLVGFIDSLATAKAADKNDVAAGKYFQYDMQNDWVALSHGDTLSPVYFDSRINREIHRKEGILVFETANGKAPDTLVYRASFGSWGTQQFIISSSKK